MRFDFLFFISLVLQFGHLVHAESVSENDSIQIVGYEIPGIIERNKKGHYDKVIQKVFEDEKLNVVYTVRPTARANAEFEAKKVDCIFPIDKTFYTSNLQLVNSEPINNAKVYIYSREGEGPWHSAEQIKGKRIGFKLGVPLGPKWESSGLKGVGVVHDEQNVDKLNNHRIDAFLAFVPDMTDLLLEKKIKIPSFDQTHPFDIHHDALLCYDNDKTKLFLQQFNQSILKLKKNGELKKLLDHSYVE